MYATSYAETIRHEGLHTCICAGCTAVRPIMHCPVIHPQGNIETRLPVDFRKVGHGIWPPHWWNGRLQAHEEKWLRLAGHLEEGSSRSESQASTSANDSDIDAMDDNLPGIHTLGLWGIKQVATRQPGPPDRTIPATTASSSRLDTQDTDSRETAQHQLPSRSAQTNKVPGQDSPCETQGESRRDKRERGRERKRVRDSPSLRIEFVTFDKNGKQSKLKMYDSLLVKSRRGSRDGGCERKRGGGSRYKTLRFVYYEVEGGKVDVKGV